MIVCSCPECQTSAGCKCNDRPLFGPIPSPRFLPVNVPFSDYGYTEVVMDCAGNVTVKVNQAR